MSANPSTSSDLYIWDLVVRFCHWGLAIAFVTNYFIVEPGRLVHEIAGYSAVALVAVRLIWGFVSHKSSYANWQQIDLSKQACLSHLSQIKQKQLPKAHGHNPFGWLMILAVLSLVIGLGVTGFMMEEIDAFFGNSRLEWVHSALADSLYICALIHIAAVFIVQHKGNIQLIRPMLTGKRKQS